MSNAAFRVSIELVVRADSIADVNDDAILDAAIADVRAREGVEFLRGSANVAPLEGCAVCGTEDAGRFDPDQSPDICIDCLRWRYR